MKCILAQTSRLRVLGLAVAMGLTVLFGWRMAIAQDSESAFIPLSTSINAVMVALVDHSAHELWDAAAADTLTGREWQTVQQHAIQLASSGTLISLGGTGAADRGWAMAPTWQAWSQEMTDAALAALDAAENANQRALDSAGGDLVDSCEGCHEAFKPDSPTEGIMHIPHYDD